MTLTEARQSLGWSKAELARQAKISEQTALNAEAGKSISGRSAVAICKALSDALGRPIRISDLEGLQVNV